ncbi:MAG TPA: GNAT family N-acetyltransferase [Burkholderiales bacterium]|nr:GNAT family N-acetyltransferase [Burkholderiales bacterium]
MRTVAARNVVLAPQVAEHAGEMFVVLGDPAIYEHENQPPASAEWLRERFARLESRRSPDGEQLWLNWVVRLRAGGLIGYVQATVLPTGRAAIAYVLASKYWGRGLAAEACRAMIAERAERYGVATAYAIFKRRNVRSARLLERLGFAPALPESAGIDLEPDELLMLRDLNAPE